MVPLLLKTGKRNVNDQRLCNENVLTGKKRHFTFAKKCSEPALRTIASHSISYFFSGDESNRTRRVCFKEEDKIRTVPNLVSSPIDPIKISLSGE